MITNERITAYLHSLDTCEGEMLEKLKRAALKEHVPILKPETAALLRAMVVLKNPGRILEVGTAVGYSALLMASVMDREARITTIENQKARCDAARANFARAGEERRITLLEGDAGALLEGLSGVFDLIFMDAAKGQYLGWLPFVLLKLAPGGLLFSDNVLQGGTIAESRYAVERRERTIHARMREYLYVLKHTPELETAILPVGDGVALSVYRQKGHRI
ncbi:MAG: O-methyltransferase [Lachnospiraceae bacterium]|jgi:predicted O-methyltransferase YrrM|nr:O-methyltransferase [Lachnospiraceae bacterium]